MIASTPTLLRGKSEVVSALSATSKGESRLYQPVRPLFSSRLQSQFRGAVLNSIEITKNIITIITILPTCILIPFIFRDVVGEKGAVRHPTTN